MRLVLAAAVVLVAAVPGAAARQAPVLRISLDRPVFSPNGNGVNDALTVRTNAAASMAPRIDWHLARVVWVRS